jgi:hypothetical protein
MTHGKMPPPTKKRKKKKPSAQPPKKESKKERCIGSWRKNWSNCSFAVVTYRKKHSFISPYKFGFVGDRKCVAAKK